MSRYAMEIPITNEKAEIRFVIDSPMRRTLIIVGQRDAVEQKLVEIQKSVEQALRKMGSR